jgi:urease accessory protein
MDSDARPDNAQLPVRAVLGNIADGGWPSRLRGAIIDVLALDAAEAHRTRLRKRTAGGTDVAIALDQGVQLRDGDVLDWDEAKLTAVVVRVDLPDVMIVDLSTLLGGPAEALLARSVEIGHALGSQHWPALVKGGRVYVPVTVAPRVMATVLKTHDVDNVSCSFAPGGQVQPLLAAHEARLLFAGSAGHSHLSDAVGKRAT